VEHYRVRTLAREIREAVFPRIPDDRLVPLRAEGLRQDLSDGLVVLDQEEPHEYLRYNPIIIALGNFFPRDSQSVEWHTQPPAGSRGAYVPETLSNWRVCVGGAGHVDSADKPLAQSNDRNVVDRLPLFDGHPRMQESRSIIESIADTDATVLIRGESGVGKDLVARAI